MSEASRYTASLPYLTAELPGIGGVIKRYDEDFIVEEWPLYPAAGEGTHTYFMIEKRGLTTLAAIRILAAKLGRKHQEFGYAGLKDAHAVTRQMLSIEHVDPARIESLSLSRIRILSVTRHTNKIKLGHHSANQFSLKIRDTIESPLPRATAIFDVLRARGVPNYFGLQRFGTRGDNAKIGRAILHDDYDEAIAIMLGRPAPGDQPASRRARELFDAGDLRGAAAAWPRHLSPPIRACRALVQSGGDAKAAWRTVHHTLRKLYVSSVQSELFNRVLARRIAAIDRLQDGDIAWKHRNGASFLVEDAALEQPRCDAFEISPTGPLPGRRTTEAQGEPGRLEEELMHEAGLTREQMRIRDGTKLDGARRPLRVPPADATIDAGQDDRGPFLHLSFALPPGAYATNVTREICKTDA